MKYMQWLIEVASSTNKHNNQIFNNFFANLVFLFLLPCSGSGSIIPLYFANELTKLSLSTTIENNHSPEESGV